MMTTKSNSNKKNKEIDCSANFLNKHVFKFGVPRKFGKMSNLHSDLNGFFRQCYLFDKNRSMLFFYDDNIY